MIGWVILILIVLGIGVLLGYGWGVHDERNRPKRGGDVTNLRRRK